MGENMHTKRWQVAEFHLVVLSRCSATALIFWQLPVQVPLSTTDLYLSLKNEIHQATLLVIQFMLLAVTQENHLKKL